MNKKKLNFWYFVVSFLLLVVMLSIEKFFFIKIDNIMYYILIGTALAALGNYIVIRIQIKKKETS
jgi:uncharacterized membrane protein